ncbi:hypothetical protein SGCZBJ_13445 [Caulobacter zeae]|uniref:Uncharacterized protein n=2 Tax=Caulobacter zeae TaxID=2055137 RepID=A0A2N5DDY7_9CAUL|nr:hypothetical protein SGCZBJ_13445 [Caulobacter zeae]
MMLAAALAVLAAPSVVEARAASSETVRADAAAARAASRAIRHRDTWPFATLDQVAALGQFWTSNSLYALRDAGGERRWVIRRAFGDLAGNKGLVWADSRTCPAVKAALEAMEALPPVRPEAPGVGVEDIKPPPLDGIAHSFWNQGARTGAKGAAVAITIDGDMDSPVAGWWSQAAASLKGCWKGDEPA